MVTNVSVAPIFPSISSVLIVLIVGLFNAASGVFLIFKLLSDTYTLKEMFTVLAIGSVLVHIRTFCLMPYWFLPKDVKNYSLFASSVVGRLVVKSKTEPTETKNNESTKIETSNNIPSLKECLSTPIFWQFLIFFNVMTVRVKTMQGMGYEKCV